MGLLCTQGAPLSSSVKPRQQFSRPDANSGNPKSRRLTALVLQVAVPFALGAFATTVKNMMYGFSPLYYPVTMRGAGVGLAVASGRIGSIVGPAAGPRSR